MNRLFGSKPKTPKPTLNVAIGGIESRVASLDVRIAKLNGELGAYQQKMANMREGAGKNAIKQRALKLLRQRRQIEAQKDQLEAQSWNMEQATMTQDSLRNTMATVDAMKSANKELRKQYGKVDLDKIEDMQDEMADLMDANAEIQETMARSYAVPEDIDETELDAELELLGTEMEAESELPAPSYLETEEPAQAQPNFVDEPAQEHAI